MKKLEENKSKLWVVRRVNLSKLKHFYLSLWVFNKTVIFVIFFSLVVPFKRIPL